MRTGHRGSDFRADRFLSVRMFHPLSKLGSTGSAGLPVPIMMYHSVSDRPENLGHPYFETNTRQETFRRHMAFLRENGYASVNLENLLPAPEDPSSGGKKIAITFDDGYADFYKNAFPVLQEFSLTATVFLPTKYIGERALKYNGRECLSWDQVVEARRCGMFFGSHTMTHPELKTLPAYRMEEEIGGSKKELEDRLGEVIATFSLPFAFPEADKEFLSRYRECLERHGYQMAVCTRIGRAGRGTDRYFMPRLPINDNDDLAFLRAKLEGGYDWLGYLQYGKKLAVRYFAGGGNADKH